MASAREMRLRIRSVKSISQVTRALQAVSATRVRRAQQQVLATRPYASKAWQVLTHIALQPGGKNLHPLLIRRATVKNVLVILISGDRGLAGAYNTNIMRSTLNAVREMSAPVHFATVGRKGWEMIRRRGQTIAHVFHKLPDHPAFADVSAVGRLAVEEFLDGRADEVYLAYTDFVNLVKQTPTIKKLLPLEIVGEEHLVMGEYSRTQAGPPATYIYEPDQASLLAEIIPRFTALQVYQAVLEAQASEHAARMVAMQNATDNAQELAVSLQLVYNRARQTSITSEMLDIAGGAEALAKATVA